MSDIVQVTLRGSRREFFLNSRGLWLKVRDRIVVRASTARRSPRCCSRTPRSLRSRNPAR